VFKGQDITIEELEPEIVRETKEEAAKQALVYSIQ
jgi:hypothetical protein